MTYPLVLELAAEGIPVRLTCGWLGFSPQGFYKWRASPICERDWDDAHLTNAIVDVHDDDPEFGYRFISDELEAAGHQASENRVHRLCREHKIWSLTTKKGRRAAGKIPGPAVHDDLVRRQFSAAHPDQVWLTDITEHPTAEGTLYGCLLKDLCSKRIVGYAFGPRMTADPGDDGAPPGHRPPTAHRHRGGSLGQGRPVPFQEIPEPPQGGEAHRIDGPGRCRWRQRTDGVLQLPAPEQRPGPPALGDP